MHCRAHSKTTGDGRFKLSVLRLTPSPEWEAGRKGASRSDRERASAGLLQSRSPRTSPMTLSASTARSATSLPAAPGFAVRSEEHTSELQSLMRISYAVFCLKKKTTHKTQPQTPILNNYQHTQLNTH